MVSFVKKNTNCIPVLFFTKFPYFTSSCSFHSCAPFTCPAELPITLSATVFGNSLTSFPYCTPKRLLTHLTSLLFTGTHLLGHSCSCPS
jgi:hypothetical protein